MSPDPRDITIINDYDVPAWLHDTFGLDTDRHYIGEGFRIELAYKDAARVHFNVMVSHAELEDLLTRRKVEP